MLNRIGELVGSSLDKTEGLSVEGKIERVGARFWLTLLVRDGGEVRKRAIASDSCADLAGAAAVTLALLLGIEVRAPEEPMDGDKRNPATSSNLSAGSLPDAGKKRTTEGGKPAPKAAPPTVTEPQMGKWSFVLRAPTLSADVGPMPKPTVGVGLGVGMRYESWRFLLAGRVSGGQTVTAPELGDGVGSELERLTGEAVTCHGWRSLPFELAPCIGLALEHVSARGFGTGVSPESRRATWPALSAGVITHWYVLDSLALFAAVTGYVELSRPRLVIEGLGEVTQFRPLAAGFMLGAEWIL